MIKISAGILGAVGGAIVGGGSRAGLGLGRAIGRGLLPTKKGATVGGRVWGLGVKGAAAAGLYAGARGASKSVSNSSGPTYTTMLRNNLLNRNIRPGELSTADAEAVRNLGMR